MRRDSIVSVNSKNDLVLINVPENSIIVCKEDKKLYIKEYHTPAHRSLQEGLVGGSITPIDNVGMLWSDILQADGAGSGLDCDLVRGLPANFESTLGEASIIRHPSGSIIQMGLVSKRIGSGSSTHSFNIQFPTRCDNVFVFPYEINARNGYIPTVVSFNSTAFSIFENNWGTNSRNANSQFRWLAYGV